MTSSLDAPGEFEFYTFQGTDGDTIDISFVWLTGFFAEGVDANIWSPTNAYVGKVQGTSTQSFALGETGTYVIRGERAAGRRHRLVHPGTLVPSSVTRAGHGGPDVRPAGDKLARDAWRVPLLHVRRDGRRHDRPQLRLADGLLRRRRGRERVVADERVRGQGARHVGRQLRLDGDGHLRDPRERPADVGNGDLRHGASGAGSRRRLRCRRR